MNAPSISAVGQIALTVGDVAVAKRFYVDVLGLTPLFDAGPNLSFIAVGGVRIMLSTSQGAGEVGRNSVLYLKTDALTSFYDLVIARGAKAERSPQLTAKMPDHELWIGFVRDPDGNLVGLMEERRSPAPFAAMPTNDYLQTVKRELDGQKQLADRAIAQLDDEQFFRAPGAGDNSVAVIVKHVSGNMRSRWTDFLNSDGEKPDRRRDSEFIVEPGDTRVALLKRWDEGWAILFAVLDSLKSGDLDNTVRIRGEGLTVLQAINRQLTHYPYHVGQIVYLAKHLAGDQWKTLSVPRGKSEEFNRAPEKYLK